MNIRYHPARLVGTLGLSVLIHLSALTMLNDYFSSSSTQIKSKAKGVDTSGHAPRLMIVAMDNKMSSGTRQTVAITSKANVSAKTRRQIDHSLLQNEAKSNPVVAQTPTLVHAPALQIGDLADFEGEGMIELELLISPEGKVVKWEIEFTDLPSEFSRVVIQAFEQAQFQPASLNGVPVTGKYRFQTIFSNLLNQNSSEQSHLSSTGQPIHLPPSRPD